MTIELEQITPTERMENAVSTYSRPSELRITDMRVATVVGHGYYPILRIDTNQGIYGLGEVRDTPGLGIDRNEDVIKAQLREGSDYFGDTSEWNRLRVGFDRVPRD